ncbi:MAG: DUF2199 domain-containing protein [Acetobacteraceae bacterium]|nr:DUF2199 domain-containing protein [Acetobacteraceae bacterium]
MPDRGAALLPTFGYLANRLPDYPETLDLRSLVHRRREGKRPLVEPEPSDHPLFRDWCDGITLERVRSSIRSSEGLGDAPHATCSVSASMKACVRTSRA